MTGSLVQGGGRWQGPRWPFFHVGDRVRFGDGL